jgi:hypothetical protein
VQPDSRRSARRRRGAARIGTLGLAATLLLLVVGGVIGVEMPASAAPRASRAARVTFGIEPWAGKRAGARPDFTFGVTPGATLADHVAVLNFSTKPLSLQVYATDAVNTATGGFGLLPAAVKPTGAGAWISLPRATSTVRVPAKTATGPGKVIVPFELRVPDTASPGDHVGGVVASLQTVGHNSSGQSVVLDQRVGTRVFVRVAGTLSPGLGISGLHSTYHGVADPFGSGRLTVTYLVTNTGNVEFALDQAVSAHGLLGASHSAALAPVPLLLPGDSLRESVTLHGVWPQINSHVVVTAQPLAAPGDADPHLASVRAGTRVWTIPWALLVAILVLAAATWLAYRQRHRPVEPDQPSAAQERVHA